jgi:hypothetical protein
MDDVGFAGVPELAGVRFGGKAEHLFEGGGIVVGTKRAGLGLEFKEKPFDQWRVVF